MDLEFDNSEGRVKAGMTGRIKVLRYDLKDKIVIPTESIIVLAADKAVMVAADGKAVKKSILISSSNETQSLVASGIQLGDDVIVQGQMQAVDGAAVKVVQ